jgi:hypothetical protein
MGKQTAVAMTDKDEEEFLAFLHTTGKIQLFEDFAPTQEGIWVSKFAARTEGHWGYDIWNKAFKWKPSYARVREDIPDTRRQAWFYIDNKHSAPVIEYTRHNFSDKTGLGQGRIYWPKFFAASPDQIDYDVNSFSDWYDQVVRWIRKNGKQRERGAGNPYFLPDAFALTNNDSRW